MQNSLTEMLRPHVAAIKQDAAAGDVHAKRIIAYYGMYCRCPHDPGARAFCEAEFAAWLGQRA